MIEHLADPNWEIYEDGWVNLGDFWIKLSDSGGHLYKLSSSGFQKVIAMNNEQTERARKARETCTTIYNHWSAEQRIKETKRAADEAKRRLEKQLEEARERRANMSFHEKHKILTFLTSPVWGPFYVGGKILRGIAEAGEEAEKERKEKKQAKYLERIYSRGHGTCLAIRTLISTLDGFKPIETLKIGDSIMRFDYDSRKIAEGEVTGIQSGTEQEVFQVFLNNGGSFTASPTQRIMVNGDWDGDWIRTKRLAQGMKISNSVIEKVKLIKQPTIVYTLVIDPIDNFIIKVGEENVICHDHSTF